ncbi:MAG: Rdx family protein, partial [bacterium]
IEFCRQCRYHLRAAWWAAELFNLYAGRLASVRLVDGETSSFEIKLNGELLHSKLKTGKFPDFDELKGAIGHRVMR